jgi:SAM-dependent methyltransferase
MVAKSIPKHWKRSSWEEKAKENPLYAIMTTDDMAHAGSEFTDEHVQQLMAKGRSLFTTHVEPALKLSAFSKADSFIIEYGCGAGRILNALVENGIACSGIDISPTMLELCRKLVPGVRSLHLCDPATGQTDLEFESATVVFSYAVVQHISSLQVYLSAVSEMCRLLKPLGVLALQVNCEDFSEGSLTRPGRTDNFEEYSLHYHAEQIEPYLKHDQNHWSGVYIGEKSLTSHLARHAVQVTNVYFHNPNKLRAVWFIGRKDQG